MSTEQQPTQPLSDEQWEAIGAREAAATPEPWRVWEPSRGDTDDMPIVMMLERSVSWQPSWSSYYGEPEDDIWQRRENALPDALFMAHSRGDIRALRREIERLRAELAAAQQQIAAAQPIIQAVANGQIGNSGYSAAGYCRCNPDALEGPPYWRHQPDCIITQAEQWQARALTTEA